jgi:hypothetical protein
VPAPCGKSEQDPLVGGTTDGVAEVKLARMKGRICSGIHVYYGEVVVVELIYIVFSRIG